MRRSRSHPPFFAVGGPLTAPGLGLKQDRRGTVGDLLAGGVFKWLVLLVLFVLFLAWLRASSGGLLP